MSSLPCSALPCLQARLVLKQFRRVPLADMEMVLPGASVHLHPNLYVTIAATALGGLAAAGVAAWQVGAGCEGSAGQSQFGGEQQQLGRQCARLWRLHALSQPA